MQDRLVSHKWKNNDSSLTTLCKCTKCGYVLSHWKKNESEIDKEFYSSCPKDKKTNKK